MPSNATNATKVLMLSAALCSALVALLHVYIIAEGPWAYAYFGAGETLTGLAEAGSWIPTVITSGLTLIFAAFAAYFAAGAGWGRLLPAMKPVLVGIALLYTGRGALVLVGWLFDVPMTAFDVWSSLLSLAIGLLHVAAVWGWMRPSRAGTAPG